MAFWHGDKRWEEQPDKPRASQLLTSCKKAVLCKKKYEKCKEKKKRSNGLAANCKTYTIAALLEGAPLPHRIVI